MRVGVLALQGDFAEHVAALRGLNGNGANGAEPSPGLAPLGRPLPEGEAPGSLSLWERVGVRVVPAVDPIEVRLPEELAAVDALIIPGGESTTIGKLMVEYGLLEPLRQRIAAGLPVFGTCAGAIVLARDIGGLDQPLVGAMDLTVRRNAFGRQLQSFETDLEVPALGEPPMRAVFIRAPSILGVGPNVEVLARLQDGTIVAARQGRLLATAFHPELTGDTRLHRYFVELADCEGLGARTAGPGRPASR